jgi:hypothetical protein
MITIRQRASAGMSGCVGTRLPPTFSKLMRDIPIAAPIKKCKPAAVHDANLTAGMRRIYDQYRAGKYSATDYSIRTAQRHRRYFLSVGIDLRASFCPSATGSLHVSQPLAKPRANSVAVKNKKVKPSPAPEPVSASSDPCRKSKCASDALSRSVHRARVQPRRAGITTGLGALAHRAR